MFDFMKRICLTFVFVVLLLTSSVTVYADSLPQTQEIIYNSDTTTDEVENSQISLTALIIFLSPVFITIVGGSALYILKRKRGEKITFFNSDE